MNELVNEFIWQAGVSALIQTTHILGHHLKALGGVFKIYKI